MMSKQKSTNYTKYAILEYENQKLSSELSQKNEMWINSQNNCTFWSGKYNELKKDFNKMVWYFFAMGFFVSMIICSFIFLTVKV